MKLIVSAIAAAALLFGSAGTGIAAKSASGKAQVSSKASVNNKAQAKASTKAHVRAKAHARAKASRPRQDESPREAHGRAKAMLAPFACRGEDPRAPWKFA